jgi:heptosyltransferase I
MQKIWPAYLGARPLSSKMNKGFVSQSNTSYKFLLVKLSSLGDVLHNLPIVWDIRRHYPQAQIDWVVEEAYVDLLKPLQTTSHFKGIDRIIPIGLRRWKKNVFQFSKLARVISIYPYS